MALPVQLGHHSVCCGERMVVSRLWWRDGGQPCMIRITVICFFFFYYYFICAGDPRRGFPGLYCILWYVLVKVILPVLLQVFWMEWGCVGCLRGKEKLRKFSLLSFSYSSIFLIVITALLFFFFYWCFVFAPIRNSLIYSLLLLLYLSIY